MNRVLEHGQFILGPEVTEFEEKAADYIGVKHAIGVNSGTDALVIALRAAGVEPGDEVLTTSFSFFATAESISNIGARPVFVDIDETTFNLKPSNVDQSVTENTKAILPVHLFGRPAEMDAIMEIAGAHDLMVVEDCAQSFGATVDGQQTGSIGHTGAFSFFPTKNLGGFGDGGMITTDDDRIDELCRKLRAHGSLKKYHNEILGYNSRLDTLQAALLLVKLNHVDELNRQRKTIAGRYHEALKGLPGITVPEPADGHVFHQYTIRVKEGKRDEVRAALKERGIGSAIYYPVPQHQLPVYSDQDWDLPVTETLAEEVLSLPIFPGLSNNRQQAVIEALRDIVT